MISPFVKNQTCFKCNRIHLVLINFNSWLLTDNSLLVDSINHGINHSHILVFILLLVSHAILQNIFDISQACFVEIKNQLFLSGWVSCLRNSPIRMLDFLSLCSVSRQQSKTKLIHRLICRKLDMCLIHVWLDLRICQQLLC